MINILAIESSCDDTSAAVIMDGIVRSNITSTQLEHSSYGGVVPELASRQHLNKILEVTEAALITAGLSLDNLSALAVTKGPGLLGSLLVGISFVKGLSIALGLPIIEVHHMHAHLMSLFATDPRPDFPLICLTVSGGHTQLIIMRDYDHVELIGETIDDAAGEAFDKTAKMLGLSYPGGPLIDKLAKDGKPIFKFPYPDAGKYNFSFSGLKTSILYFLRDQTKINPDFIALNLNDICASIQHAITEILISKISLLVKETGIKNIAIVGGVSANSSLRSKLFKLADLLGAKAYIPSLDLCTDNAGMVGIAAYYKYKNGNFSNLYLTPDPRWKL